MIEIREATIDDVEGIVKVNIDVWQTAYEGIIHNETLRSLCENLDERIDRFKNEYIESINKKKRIYQAVALDNGEVVGFIKYGDYRNDENYSFINTAEVYAIYIYDKYQGNQIGTRLINYASTHMIELNMYKSLIIWTLKQNKSRSFYEHIGGEAKFDREISIRNQTLEEVGYNFDSLKDLKMNTEETNA